MKPWNEPVDRIPTGKVTLWQGFKDKTCPKGSVEKTAEIVKGAFVQCFPDEGYCVLFAKQDKLAEALNSGR